MSGGLVTERIPVSAVVARRPATSPWAEWTWRAVAVVPPIEAPPWTRLRATDGEEVFLAGSTEVEIHSSDTTNYVANLQADPPLVWVVLRPAFGGPMPHELFAVTVDPGEAHLYAENGNDLLESLPMPEGLRAALESFCAAHHRERTFHKRRRDRLDPATQGRRSLIEDEE